MADESVTPTPQSEAVGASAATRPAKSSPKSGKDAAKRGLFASLGLFIRQIIAELRKVVRPTRSEWVTYTTVVIIFVVTIMMLVFGLDAAFTKLVFWVFAGPSS